MLINIRKTNHSKREKNKKSEWLYVNNKNEIKKVILTGDKELINDKIHLEDLHTLIHYIGEGTYFEMINPKNWVTHYNKYINYNPMYSIQIEVSNIEGTPQLIFEDNSISYNVENLNIKGKEFCKVNLEDYNINLYLPITTQIECKEI